MQYELLFREMNHYETLAASTQSSQEREHLANYHQNQFQLSETKSAIVRQASRECVTKLLTFDQEARQIVLVSRGANKNLKEKIPPPPSRLAELQNKRVELLRTTIAGLKSSMGASDFAYFDARVKNYISTGIRDR